MPPAKRYKPSANVAWRRVQEEIIVLDLTSSLYYTLNETAAFVWERLEAGDDVAKAAERLGAEYGRDASDVRGDVDDIVDSLRKQKLIAAA